MPSREARAFPSGAQVELVHRGQRAVVVEVGGALRTYEANGLPVLEGYEAGEMCSGARGQPLIPWPNRLRDGRYSFDGETHQLPLSEPAKRNAIHGLVRWASWTTCERTAARVLMEHTLHPQPGYPFALRLAIDYQLGEDGLHVRTTATNLGTSPCPYGAGAHPYLTLGTSTIDQLELSAPGSIWLPADDRGIPTGERSSVEGTEYDFRAARQIGQTKLDTGFTELERDDDGLARVTLNTPNRGPGVTLWLDRSYPYLMLFTGDSLPDPARRRRGLGIEPMTCAPNAFQTGDGLQRLAPGESFTSSWGITPSALAGDPAPAGGR
jgi:aldose 1-epimerase